MMNNCPLYKKKMKNGKEVVLRLKRIRDIIETEYAIKNNVETRNFFYSIRNQPCLKNLIPKRVPKTLNSDILWDEGIYLPSSHDIKISEIKKICNLIKLWFQFQHKLLNC